MMAKAWRHAERSAELFGGRPGDYLPVHHQMDEAKSAHAEATHRIVFHSAYGVFLVEKLLGTTLTNSDGDVVCVRDVAEQHVLDDLGFIPSLSDWLGEIEVEPWMLGLGTRTIEIVD